MSSELDPPPPRALIHKNPTHAPTIRSSPLRRAQCKIFDTRKWLLPGSVYYGWRSQLHIPFEPANGTNRHSNGYTLRSYKSKGWIASSWANIYHQRIKSCNILSCLISSCIYWCRRLVGLHASIDKQNHYHDLAFKAQTCAENNDFAGTFKIIRSMSGFSPRPIKAVGLKDGSFTKSEEERQQRWQEYFADLLSGSLTDSMYDTATASTSLCEQPFQISVQWTEDSIAELGNNRACGPDETHAEY